jgi:hypothetical protein
MSGELLQSNTAATLTRFMEWILASSEKIICYEQYFNENQPKICFSILYYENINLQKGSRASALYRPINLPKNICID